MPASAQNAADMGRPKSENPRVAVVSIRTFPELRQAIEDYASREHRSMAQMTELLLREAIIARRKREKESTKDIDGLP